MAAARLSFAWFGVRRSLSSVQKNLAADSFNAEGKYLSAGKKLLDTTHPAYKAVTAIRGRAVAYWKGVSLPYPEPGIRLIQHSYIYEFDNRIDAFREELDEVVTDLDQRYGDLRESARQRLGDLFDATDYPPSLIVLFSIERDYPSVEPPDYLRRLNPELYKQECQRVQSRFDQAVQLAEQAFAEELSGLVGHLAKRLSGETDGKPKVFRDSAVANLSEFFERFRQLSIRSNEQLDDLIRSAQSLIHGIQPQELRNSRILRQTIANEMTTIQSSVDQFLMDRPRRNIIRRPR